MSRFGKFFLIAAAMIGAASMLATTARADFGPPRVRPPLPFTEAPPKEATLPLVVKVDPNATVSKLILPPGAASDPIDQIDRLLNGDTDKPNDKSKDPKPAPRSEEAPKGALFESPLRSIFAGLCLSIAIAAVFFVPRVGGVAQMLLVGAVGLGVIGMAAAAFADVAPDPLPPPKTSPLAAAPKLLAGGRVEIEWTGKRGEPVTLIIAGKAMKDTK